MAIIGLRNPPDHLEGSVNQDEWHHVDQRKEALSTVLVCLILFWNKDYQESNISKREFFLSSQVVQAGSFSWQNFGPLDILINTYMQQKRIITSNNSIPHNIQLQLDFLTMTHQVAFFEMDENRVQLLALQEWRDMEHIQSQLFPVCPPVSVSSTLFSLSENLFSLNERQTKEQRIKTSFLPFPSRN